MIEKLHGDFQKGRFSTQMQKKDLFYLPPAQTPTIVQKPVGIR